MVLLWLVPPVVVTVTAMLWVSWLGREGRGEVSREEALRRLGVALDDGAPRWRRRLRRRSTPGYAVAPVARDRSSGVVVRRDRPAAAPTAPAAPTGPTGPAASAVPPQAPGEPQRRAS